MKRHYAKRPATRFPSRPTATSAPLVVDNGIELSSDAPGEAIRDLGIAWVTLRPLNPLYMPVIERAFKSVHGRFLGVPDTAQTASRTKAEEPK